MYVCNFHLAAILIRAFLNKIDSGVCFSFLKLECQCMQAKRNAAFVSPESSSHPASIPVDCASRECCCHCSCPRGSSECCSVVGHGCRDCTSAGPSSCSGPCESSRPSTSSSSSAVADSPGTDTSQYKKEEKKRDGKRYMCYEA